MDYNFFEPIKKQKKKSNLLGALLIGIMLAGILGLGFLIAMEKITERAIQEQMHTNDQMYNNEKFIELSNEVSKLEEKISINQVKAERSLALTLFANMAQTGSREIINTINDQITLTTTLDNLSIIGDSVSFSAESASLNAVTQFYYNLETCGKFAEVSIQTITIEELEEGRRVFSYIVTFKIIGAVTENAQAEIEEAIAQEVEEAEEAGVENAQNQ